MNLCDRWLKTTMGHSQLHTRTMTRFIWLQTIKGRLTAVNMTTAIAQSFVRWWNAVNWQRQLSSRELKAKMSFLHVLVVMQNVLRFWQKVATNPLNNMLLDNLPRGKKSSRNHEKQPWSSLHFALEKQLTSWQWIRVCALHHSVAMTHVLHYKFNMATKMAQIYDQLKECEEVSFKIK